MGKAANLTIGGVMIASVMIGSVAVRPWLAIVGSVLSFALLIETAGLIPAVIVTVLVASRGSRAIAMREALFFGVCLAAAMSILFVLVLDQPFMLIRGW
jgi:putative tricarboxylic transport membrane protein